MQRRLMIPGWPIRETKGDPITAFGRQITPVGRVLEFSWLGGSFMRHQPTAIEVRQGDVMRRLPIHNATARAITTIILIGLALVILASSSKRWMRSRR